MARVQATYSRVLVKIGVVVFPVRLGDEHLVELQALGHLNGEHRGPVVEGAALRGDEGHVGARAFSFS